MFDLSFVFANLSKSVAGTTERSVTAKHVAEAISVVRRYRWVGLYEVTQSNIGMIACTGSTPPAFPRFLRSKGLCDSTVAARAIVNAGNVQEDPRWLATFGTTRSEIIVPVLAASGEVRGLIDAESDALNAFSNSDEEFLSTCARMIQALFP